MSAGRLGIAVITTNVGILVVGYFVQTSHYRDFAKLAEFRDFQWQVSTLLTGSCPPCASNPLHRNRTVMDPRLTERSTENYKTNSTFSHVIRNLTGGAPMGNGRARSGKQHPGAMLAITPPLFSRAGCDETTRSGQIVMPVSYWAGPTT